MLVLKSLAMPSIFRIRKESQGASSEAKSPKQAEKRGFFAQWESLLGVGADIMVGQYSNQFED